MRGQFKMEEILITETEVLEQIEKKQDPPEPVKTENKPALIAINERGMVEAKNNSELLRYCGAIVNSGIVPDRFNTPQKLFGALMFVRGLGLSDVSIRQVAVIHGVPSLFGDLPLSLVQAKGELEKFQEFWIDREYNKICFENKNFTAEPWAAVCFMKRKGQEVGQAFYTMDDAVKANQYPPKKRDGSALPESPWNRHTKMMLRYKARSICLKSVFADHINGVSIAEYDNDLMGEENMKDIGGSQDAAAALMEITQGK